MLSRYRLIKIRKFFSRIFWAKEKKEKIVIRFVQKKDWDREITIDEAIENITTPEQADKMLKEYFNITSVHPSATC